jgi:predicted nucleic-acid-binding Zn-ribbon protein
MIIQDPPGKAKCPECGSGNVKSKLSFTTIMALVGKLLGVPAVKIFEKGCVECGHKFQMFRK